MSTLTWSDFYGLQRFGMTRDLVNINLFCERLSHPELTFPSIHIGGTNGKGTVAAILDSVFRAAGYHVGKYSSPHILHFGERILVSGRQISDAEVFAFLEKHWDFIKQNRCTFFETATAMAFDYFANQKVDLGVVEVGLGGTYDATGVVDTALSVLTRVDFDHVDRLGNSLTEIAADKAGIFRSGKPALTSAQQTEVMDVLKDRARVIGAPFVDAGDIVHLLHVKVLPEGIRFDADIQYDYWQTELVDLWFSLTGYYQIENVVKALAAVVLLKPTFPNLDEGAIKIGLQDIQWPGRLQILSKEPTVILDVAHNPGAFRSILADIERIWAPERLHVVFAAASDKDIPGILSELHKRVDCLSLPDVDHERMLGAEHIEKLVRELEMRVQYRGSVREVIRLALREAQSRDMVLIAGSHYLAEEVLKSVEWS